MEQLLLHTAFLLTVAEHDNCPLESCLPVIYCMLALARLQIIKHSAQGVCRQHIASEASALISGTVGMR